MFAYCKCNPIILSDEHGDRPVYCIIDEDTETITGRFFRITVTVAIKTIVGSIYDGVSGSVTIGDNKIEVSYEYGYAQYSFGVDENKAFVGVGCVFDKTSYMLEGTFFSDELTCAVETEVADGVLLEVAITVTSDNRGMLDHAVKRASPFLAAASSYAIAYAFAYAGSRRPALATEK